ncbi:MAG: BON domain-containing protein [Rickettsiales bacterium]
MKLNNYLKIATILTLPIALNACVAAALVTGTQAAKTLAEERSAGSRVDDNAIDIALKNKFVQKDLEGLFGSVSTDINEGRVLLTGKVKDEITKKDASRLAWEVGGVKEVINELQADDKGSIASYMEDAWIANQVRTRMLFTKRFRDINYDISVVNTVVYIMGIAQTQEELEAATEIARRTKGVTKVVSHAVLKDDPRRGIWAEKPTTSSQ